MTGLSPSPPTSTASSTSNPSALSLSHSSRSQPAFPMNRKSTSIITLPQLTNDSTSAASGTNTNMLRPLSTALHISLDHLPPPESTTTPLLGLCPLPLQFAFHQGLPPWQPSLAHPSSRLHKRPTNMASLDIATSTALLDVLFNLCFSYNLIKTLQIVFHNSLSKQNINAYHLLMKFILLSTHTMFILHSYIYAHIKYIDKYFVH